MPDQGRVVAGTARGVRLESPATGTRPLSDRVKQSLFAALEADGDLDGPFLDLFAGSGAGGIEALSRGAPRATFVERDGTSCQAIGANLRRAKLEGGRIVRADVVTFLHNGRAAADEPYRAALVDPPYGESILEQALELLGDPALGWLTGDAVVVAKHFWRDQPAERMGALGRSRVKRFGETMLTFYTRVVGPDREEDR